MTRTAYFALIALAVAACDSPTTETDAGTDAGQTPEDGGPPDSGPLPDSGPPPDAGPTGCTSGCAFVQLALGSDHTCARRENGEVWCWGRNQEGQVGDNRPRHETNCAAVGTDPVDCTSIPQQVRTRAGTTIGLLLDATSISSEGGLSTCAVRESGEVWCWGLEGIARVNGGMREYRLAAQRIEDFGGVSQASDGWLHLCMVQGAEDRVVCYGYNESGQLGVGDRMEIRIPDDARPVRDPSDTSMALEGVLEVTASGFGDTTCARTADTLYCWGTNRDGQLGDGSGSHDATACTPSMTASYDCSNTPVVVGDGAPLANVGQVTAGIAHVCALGTGDDAGTVWCWGDNRAGQLAQPGTVSSANVPTAVEGLGEAVQIDAGGRTTCARLADGTVWCWGFNLRGQLGDGTMDHATTCTFGDTSGDCSRVPVQVSGIDDAVDLDIGQSHACVIRASGEIWCWGYNDNRQLGDNTRMTRYAPVRVVALPD